MLYRVAVNALAATLCAFTTTFTALAATFTGRAWFTLFAAYTRFAGLATFRALRCVSNWAFLAFLTW